MKDITSVAKLRRADSRSGTGYAWSFLVGIGESVESEIRIEFSADELFSYSKFKRAVLRKAGMAFSDYDVENSRRRGMTWSDVIEWWIESAETVEAAG
ncbi:MAG: hypothetical protein SGJ19_07865 [Planctomycetia bacterium]|nr:hypothetical protein [Planctomycetia bacterium]